MEKPDWEVTAEEDLTKSFTKISSNIMFATLRTIGGTDSDFEQALSKFGNDVHELREKKKKSDEVIEKLIKAWREEQERKKAEDAKIAALKAKAVSELAEVTKGASDMTDNEDSGV
jgi:hypothetical protein